MMVISRPIVGTQAFHHPARLTVIKVSLKACLLADSRQNVFVDTSESNVHHALIPNEHLVIFVQGNDGALADWPNLVHSQGKLYLAGPDSEVGHAAKGFHGDLNEVLVLVSIKEGLNVADRLGYFLGAFLGSLDELVCRLVVGVVAHGGENVGVNGHLLLVGRVIKTLS